MMKASIALVCILGVNTALAQPNTVTTPPCDDPNCLAAQYNYFMCDGNGNLHRKCTSDPNHEPGMKMYKKATPVALCDDFSNGRTGRVYVPNGDPLDPHDINVFIWSNVADRLREAERRWEFICPPQGPNKEYQDCCLRVTWSTTISDMGRYPDAEAVTHIRVKTANPLEAHSCEYDCANSIMVINQDPSHTLPDANGVPTHFFYTEPANKGALPPGYEYSSMYSILLHELGHWLGFGHSDDAGGDDYGNVCDHSGSIMRTGYSTDWIGIDRDLSYDDICMFKKAYCCAQTAAGVKEEQAVAGELSFDVSPNPPKNNSLNIMLSRLLTGRSGLLRLISPAGVVVLEKKLDHEARQVSIDVATLANGVYMVEVFQGGNVSSQKVLIQR